jgi:hypothetical protein
VTINLDPGERKRYEHNIKIVAVERRVLGYSRDREIQRGRGNGSRQTLTPL